MIRKLYQTIMRLRCRIFGHRFWIRRWVDEYQFHSEVMCQHCDTNIKELRDEDS